MRRNKKKSENGPEFINKECKTCSLKRLIRDKTQKTNKTDGTNQKENITTEEVLKRTEY